MLGRIAFAALTASLVLADSYTWKNVHTGGGGGWIGNVVFNPSQKVISRNLCICGHILTFSPHPKGVAYLRTDIGGAYKLAADGVSWTPLLDFADNAHWNYWGVYVTSPSSSYISSDEVLGRASRQTLLTRRTSTSKLGCTPTAGIRTTARSSSRRIRVLRSLLSPYLLRSEGQYIYLRSLMTEYSCLDVLRNMPGRGAGERLVIDPNNNKVLYLGEYN
jgi:xyloglucan-specific exo-beta-1,4-glucanase